jgi:hypothetical protein
MKLCMDCVHFQQPQNAAAVCIRGGKSIACPVYGKLPVIVGVCKSERAPWTWPERRLGMNPSRCGPDAVHFQSRIAAAKAGAVENLSALDADLGTLTVKPVLPKDVTS